MSFTIVVISAIAFRNEKDDAKVETSETLHKEMNEERKREGKSSIDAINTVQGISTNNLAKKDNSWDSVPDFFVKGARGELSEDKVKNE